MRKNQLFLNYLMLIFCFTILYSVIYAQSGCSEGDRCRHSVEIKNTSCCEVEIWCQEIGCDGQDYYMGKLASGKTFSGQPDAYGAKFKIANNGSYVHEFPQLDRDGNCYSYDFEYKGSTGNCSKPVLQINGDQHICKGQSVEICASGADGYWWSTGEDKRCITVSPHETTTYQVLGIKNGCEDTGDITVNVNDSFNLGTDEDQTICKGQSVEICASGTEAYWWSTDEYKRCITVSPYETTTYLVIGGKNECEASANVTVSVNDSFKLGTSGDQRICKGQSIEICASGADDYWWSTGEDIRCITVSPNHTKTFTVKGVKNGCEDSQDIEVSVNDSFNLHTTDDQTIEKGQSVEICASGADGYWWSNGKEGACITVSPAQDKTYIVIGAKNGCEVTGQVNIHVNVAQNTCSIDDIKLEEWSIGSTKAVIAWSKYNNAEYTLYLRIAGSHKWYEFQTDYADVELNNLMACTTYEWAVSIKCSNVALSDISHIRTFTTSGHCGSDRIGDPEAIGINQSIDEGINLISVFPNPANNWLTINYKNVPLEELAIYNSMGVLVEYVNIEASGQTAVQVQDYTSGVYLIIGMASDKLHKNVFVVE